MDKSFVNTGFNHAFWAVMNSNITTFIAALFLSQLGTGPIQGFAVSLAIGPLCRGKDKAELFAGAVNRLYDHCVKKRGLTMYMWGDRLINSEDEESGYKGEYESSCNGRRIARMSKILNQDEVDAGGR